MKTLKFKTIIYVFVILIGVVLSLLILLLSAKLPNDQKNGFNRNWLTTVVNKVDNINISSPFKKICGATKNFVFFRVEDPRLIVKFDRSSRKYDTIFFPLEVSEKMLGANNLTIDSPWIFFFVNNIPAIFYSKIWRPRVEMVDLDSSLFTRSLYLSPSTAIIRTIDSRLNKQVFQKVNSRTGQVINQADIVPSQEDGGFSTDGTLHFDHINSKIIFTLYHQNRFYCLDTNLNIMYEGKTIDTTDSNTASIKIVTFEGKDMLMPQKASMVVNRNCWISQEYICIESGLRADNETRIAFENNSVIDMYSIADGTYKGSFYIPNFKNKKLKSLFAKGNEIFVLYPDGFTIFNLRV